MGKKRSDRSYLPWVIFSVFCAMALVLGYLGVTGLMKEERLCQEKMKNYSYIVDGKTGNVWYYDTREMTQDEAIEKMKSMTFYSDDDTDEREIKEKETDKESDRRKKGNPGVLPAIMSFFLLLALL